LRAIYSDLGLQVPFANVSYPVQIISQNSIAVNFAVLKGKQFLLADPRVQFETGRQYLSLFRLVTPEK